jgi:hypothetical protein
MAPFQSPVELIQAPSTQAFDWATVKVIGIAGKFADSRVPVHVPDMFANRVAGVGEGVLDDAPHALATQATKVAPSKTVRLGATDYEYRLRTTAQSRAGR